MALEDRIADRIIAKLTNLSRPVEDEPPTLQAGESDSYGTASPAPASAGLSDEVVAELQAKCLRCHGATAPKGRLSLFDASGNFAPAYTDGRSLSWATLLDEVSGDQPAMPKGVNDPAKRLPPEAVEAIRRLAGG